MCERAAMCIHIGPVWLPQKRRELNKTVGKAALRHPKAPHKWQHSAALLHAEALPDSGMIKRPNQGPFRLGNKNLKACGNLSLKSMEPWQLGTYTPLRQLAEGWERGTPKNAT